MSNIDDNRRRKTPTTIQLGTYVIVKIQGRTDRGNTGQWAMLAQIVPTRDTSTPYLRSESRGEMRAKRASISSHCTSHADLRTLHSLYIPTSILHPTQFFFGLLHQKMGSSKKSVRFFPLVSKVRRLGRSLLSRLRTAILCHHGPWKLMPQFWN